MQVTSHSCKVAPCGLRQPPRSWPFRAAGPVVNRGCIHFRHAHSSGSGRSTFRVSAAQTESATVQTNSATSPDDSAVPVVSENASAEVPHSQVASQVDLEAAQQKTNSGPTDVTGSNEQRQAPQGGTNEQRQAPQGARSSMSGRSSGRSARRPKTVRKEQLVPGAEFEGNVVSVLAYGAFVDIGAVTDGLVHVSQMTDAFVSDPGAIVKNGQLVNVRISSWDPAANRLSLTMKNATDSGMNGDSNSAGPSDDGQARRNPRQGKVATAGAARKGRKSNSQPIPVKVGDVLKDVKVQSMLGWGAFIDVGSGHRGLLHVDEMKWPEGAMAPSAYDCVKEDQAVEVRVLKIADGKIQLTMKSEDERKQESDMSESGVGAGGTKKARNTLEAALARVGFKHTPEAEAESDNKATASPADNGVTAAAAPAHNENQAEVHLETSEEKDALERQINPKGSPTPIELPAEAQRAADESNADEAAMEGDDSAGGTADQSNTVEVIAPKDDTSASPATIEVAEGASSKEGADASTDTVTASGANLDKGVEDEALKRQTNPTKSPTPVELPPEAEKAAQDAREAALEGDDDKAGTADKSNTVEVTAPDDDPSAHPTEVAEGEEPPAVKAQANGSAPSKESNLPADAPPEVGEGENPDAVEQSPGTADESDTVQVTAPEESDSAEPAEVAEGEESPAAAKAEASNGSQSAAFLSDAKSASELPGVHSQVTEAAPAKNVGQDSSKAERTAPPPASSSSPPAGGGGGRVSALSVKQETGSVSALSVKQLRQETGAGMMDCKRALTEANGDIHLATEALRKKGLAAADKKAGRVAAEGLLAQYIHAGSRLGVLVEVNCETDFVARGDVFKELASDMAMQVAACSQVTVVDSSQVPADVVDKERSVQMGKEDILQKPEAIRGKIVDGRIQKFLSEQALLDQAFIKDTSKTVATVIKEAVATVGEKVSIRRFERFQLGEGITKKESDLAADVEEQQQALQAKAAQKKDQAPEAAQPQQSQQPAVKVDAKLVKQLRGSSGAGMMDCKKALASNDNNLEKATEFLRKKGLASADKKAGRVASEGAIGSYVHAGSKLGVLIEVNCETDFVARGAKFKELVQDMAMQAAASPSAIVVAVQDVPEQEIEKERAIEMGKEDIQSKPEAIRPKIVEGRLNKIRSQKALLEQPFIKDTGSSVAEHIKAAVASLGENIQIRRFVRYNLGEGIEKKTQDFAAEVAAQTGQ